MTMRLGSFSGAQVLDPFCGSGGFAMENLIKLMEAASGLIIALSILLAVIGAFYRR
jgi:16S rRNA G966 N2-methylase RsmD